MSLSTKQLKTIIDQKLSHHYGLTPDEADTEHVYKALVLAVRDILIENQRVFADRVEKKEGKRVYYLCVEFLMGRSLRNNLFNLGLEAAAAEVMPKYHTTLDKVYENEPDAGLGNGGLGRLAACYLDGMATEGYLGMGYSLRYEFGIFQQKFVDGWQTELPDFWLPGGSVWLVPQQQDAVEISFGGTVEERWDGEFHAVYHNDASVIKATPYDMMCAGYGGKGVSTLRLWAAESVGGELDMALFNDGDYLRSIEQRAMAEMLTKVLYPSDNHLEGKSLRLSQQYFLVSASIQDIIKRHLRDYRTMDNFADVVCIHINDTHPALAIPELMRILMDECGFSWDSAFDAVKKTMAYTNHTVLAEALECWSEELFSSRLPRIYQIVCELNRRFCDEMTVKTGYDYDKVARMSIVAEGFVKMANLCVAVSHSVNGVSELHSEIIKDDVFNDFYTVMPEKFRNVTNGITHRRWLCQGNPMLSKLITELIGDGFITDASKLEDLMKYKDDKKVLAELAKIKRGNKERLANYIYKNNGIKVDPDSIFDVQAKRLHEYKRQHMNALHIIQQYQWLADNPTADFVPKTYIFGAKAAPGYFLAKQIIRLICNLADQINNDSRVNDKLKVVFLENYRVSVAEILMPAAEISEQISLAGTEASGTGNMKFMINGAVTLGTEDGANIEIHRDVGDENILIFGMSAPEAARVKSGYDPGVYYRNNPDLHAAIDSLKNGFGGVSFADLAGHLLTYDTYMALADFADFQRIQKEASQKYADPVLWNGMSLVNIAKSGVFSSDRSINDYARGVWGVKPVK